MGRNKDNYDKEDEKKEKYLERLAPHLGYLVIAFNSLESSLDTAIVEFMNGEIPEVGIAVISGMSFSAKVELFGRLYGPLFMSVKDQKWMNDLTVVLQELKEANNKRNDFIHAAWHQYDLLTKSVVTKTRIHKNEREDQEKNIQPKDIKNATRFINRLADKLFEIYVLDHGSWLQ